MIELQQFESGLARLEAEARRVRDGESDYGTNLYGGQPDGSLPRVFADRGALPAGIIVMWSGDPTALPPGWLLCDGTEGTPGLSERFIVGYKSGHAEYGTIGNTGGYKFHGLTENNHSDHELSHIHQWPEMVEKAFSTCLANGSACIWGFNDEFVPQCDTGSGEVGGVAGWCGGDGRPDFSPPDGSNRAKHDGPFQDDEDPPNDYQNTDNRPPYYVLAFIIKL